MAQPRVTVVVPTRDRPALLLQTLACVLGQRNVDLEVVVVDNGDRLPVSPALEEWDPRLSVIRPERPLGVVGGRNAGLAVAQTPWVTFVDDDDLWAPDKLAHQLAALERDPECRWSCTTSAPFYPDGTIISLQEAPDRDAAVPLLQTNVVPGGGSSVLVATELLRAVGGFDPQFANLADWECWLRLAQQSPVAAVRSPDVGFRRHPASMSHAVEQREAELPLLLAKHASSYAEAAVGTDPREWLGTQSRLLLESGRTREGLRSAWRLYRARGRAQALVLPLRYGSGLHLRRLEERIVAHRDPHAYTYLRRWLDAALLADPAPQPRLSPL